MNLTLDHVHPIARRALVEWLEKEATPSKALPIFPGRTAVFHALPGRRAARVDDSETVLTIASHA